MVDLDTWALPPIFTWLMDKGPVESDEMLRAFNCGIALIGVYGADDPAPDGAFAIGHVVEGHSAEGKGVRYSGRLKGHP